MPTLGVAVVVLQHERVLLTQREDFANWCLPGGAVENGETLDQAALREVREETGLDIHLTQLVGMVSKPLWGKGGTHIVVFAAVPTSTMLAPQASEVIDLGFFDAQDLPDPFFWEHRAYLRAARAATTGHVWVNTVQPPAMFADRNTLYQWRDSLGVSRAAAYEQLMAACEPQELVVRLGPVVE